jgi:hypothetical protein
MVLADGLFKREGMRTEATGRARMHRSLAGAAAHHTRLSLSSCRIHGTTRFQLAPVRSTILRLRALTPSVSFGSASHAKDAAS